MNLSVFWRLKDLISPAVQQVIRSARHAQEVMARANQSMQRGWRDSGETINSLRKKIQDLETARNAMRIGVDTRQIQAANVQIDRLNRQLDNLEGRGRRAEGRGGWLGGLMPKGLGVGLGLMGAVSTAQGALNKGMEREAVEAQFKYFVGNAEVAQNLINQLKQYGDKYTMYNKGDLMSSGAALAETFGSGEVMKMTKIIGALAKGKSENFMGIMTRLQQVKGTGYLQQDELLELQNRGVFGIQEQIIKNKNITLAQFNKLKEAQKISYADVEQALLDMTSQGGKYGGFLDEAMKQTKAKWDSIKNIVDEKMTNIGEMTSGKLNEVLDWFFRFLQSTKPIEDAMSRLGNAFKPIFSAIRDLLVHLGLINPAGDSVQQVVSLLTNVINIMATAVHWAGGMLQWLVSVFQAIPFSKYIGQFLLLNLALKSIGVFSLISTITSVGTSLFSLSGIIGLVQKAWVALNSVFVLSPVGLIITAVVALAAALYYAWNESAKFREVVMGLWGGVQEVWLRITEIWGSIVGFFKEVSVLMTAIGMLVSDIWNRVMNWVREQWNKLVEWFKGTSFGGWIFETIDKIGKAWSGMMDNLKKWWDGAKDYMIAGFRFLMAVYTLGLSEVGIAIYKQFNKGYQKGVTNQQNQESINKYHEVVAEKRRVRRLTQDVPNLPPPPPKMPPPTGGAGSGSGSGGGISDTVEGAKSKNITINLNKGLIETSNIIVDNKATGLDIERQVVEALNRVLRGADRLVLE